MKEKKIKIIAILAGVIAALVCVAAGIYIVGSKKKEDKYDAVIKNGDKYLEAADYEAAIETYTKAIEIDETDEYAYIQLATAYEAAGQMDEVDRILTLGYQTTRSGRLQDMMNNLIAYGSVFGTTEAVLSEAVDEVKEEVQVNDAYFQSILDQGYEDYKGTYGDPAITKSNGGNTVGMTFNGFSGTIYYVNGTTEIVDPGTGIPNGNIRPSYIQVADLSTIFNGFTGTIGYDEICTLFNETAQVQFTNTYTYIMVHYQSCEIYLECDADGNIVSADAWNRIIVPGAGEGETTVVNGGTIGGKVISATTGIAVAGVKLSFREGRGNKNGDVVAEYETDNQGNYLIELSEGYYTVCAEADGYTTEYFEVNVVSGMTLSGQDFTISSELASGEARIVLEWGAAPTDLDSHLFYSGSRGEAHVSFSNKVFEDLIELDVDDVTGYGPETITISDISEGTFTYGVYNFSGESPLASSGATVKVYLPGQSQPTVYTIPLGEGYYWEVFQIENGQLSEINSIRDTY